MSRPKKMTTRVSGGIKSTKSNSARGAASMVKRPKKKKKIGRKILFVLILSGIGWSILKHPDMRARVAGIFGDENLQNIEHTQSGCNDSTLVANNHESNKENDAINNGDDGEKAEEKSSIWEREPFKSVKSEFDELFAVGEIRIRGVESIDEQTFAEMLDTLKSKPILELDLSEIADCLSEYPRVKRAAIRRRLPSTLFVDVEERREIALILTGGHLVGVDEDGVVLSQPVAGWALDVPVITGYTKVQEAGEVVEGATIVQALEWIRRVQDLETVCGWISEIHVGDDGVETITGVNGWRVQPGEHDVLAQAAAMDTFIKNAGFSGSKAKTVDLRFPGFLIVRDGL